MTVTLRSLLFAILSLAAAGCATVPTDPAELAAYEEANDPLEPMNRAIFEFNMFLDRNAIKPVAQAYVDVVPEEGRRAIRNVLNNLNEPVVFGNNLLQAEVTRAATTAARFVLNSTLGLAGIFDVATDLGFQRQYGDFGQTLFAWGLPDGPFLMLPVFGPSNPRDTVGKVADTFMDPWGYVIEDDPGLYFNISRGVTDGVDRRAQVLDELEQIERTSIDFYAQIRSLWRQRRQEELYHGNPPPPKFDYDIYEDPAAPK